MPNEYIIFFVVLYAGLLYLWTEVVVIATVGIIIASALSVMLIAAIVQFQLALLAACPALVIIFLLYLVKERYRDTRT